MYGDHKQDLFYTGFYFSQVYNDGFIVAIGAVATGRIVAGMTAKAPSGELVLP